LLIIAAQILLLNEDPLMKLPNRPTLAAICSVFALAVFTAASGIGYADHNTEESLHSRLAPVGSLNVLTAEQAAEQAAAAPVAVAASDEEPDGETVYNSSCVACHGSGAGGAPKLGDEADWEKRLGQGFEVLIEHAIQGYQGEAGLMPARGGNASLSDEEVAAAVEYIIDES